MRSLLSLLALLLVSQVSFGRVEIAPCKNNFSPEQQIELGHKAVQQVYAEMPVRPDSYYGVSKAFGENLGRYYYDEWGLEFIALRIGWFLSQPPGTDQWGDTGRAMWLSPRDCAQVFRRAIEADVPFGIFYAISGNPDRRWDITDTIVKLGYRPQDSWDQATTFADGV